MPIETPPPVREPSAGDRPSVAQPTAQVSETVREVERALRRRGLQLWLQRILVVLGLAIAGGGLYTWREVTRPPPAAKFTTELVERRDVIERVEATGKLEPVTKVEVSAQVSGRVVKVHADFNDRVKRGDLLAEIDPSLFGAQVSQVNAQLAAAKAAQQRAEAQRAAAEITLRRAQALVAERLGTEAELDQARAARNVAEADVAAAKAQLAQLGAQLTSARTTLAYSRIFSPIDGLVIERAVEPGQTVAASFAAPRLFVIAEDLRRMRALADIDEADVGKLAEGMKAKVVVDAFPGKEFHGVLTQLRFSPNELQGVVTYSAVIEVDNPELALRPGMTASVSIRTREARGVAAVRNAALRFRPAPEKNPDGTPKLGAELPPLGANEGRLFVSAGGAPGAERSEPKLVKLGITDGIWTELRDGALAPGAAVITDERETKPTRGIFFR